MFQVLNLILKYNCISVGAHVLPLDCLFCLDWSSALRYITDGDTDDHLDMLDGGIIKQLLDDKWKTFARVCQVIINILEQME